MVDKRKLIQDKNVVEEINRHKWLQSELAGHDIGFDKAADDWFKKHAEAWVKANAGKESVKKRADGKRKKKLRE